MPTTRTTAPEPAAAAALLAALPLRPRAGLYIQPAQGHTGGLLILERTDDPEAGDAIIGLAIRDEDGWYLGCTGCRTGIEEADAGMCQPCRQDAAWQDQQNRAAWEDQLRYDAQ